MTNRKRFVDPYSYKRKSNRHRKHYMDQKKIRKLADAQSEKYYNVKTQKVRRDNGKMFYRRFYTSDKNTFSKQKSNKKVRQQILNEDDDLHYSMKGSNYKKIYDEWW